MIETSFIDTKYIINNKEYSRRQLIQESKKDAMKFFHNNGAYPDYFYYKGILIRKYEYG